MIISEVRQNKKIKEPDKVMSNDLINIVKFNSLPPPVTARLIANGGDYWIESLCVQTGIMRLDVYGQIDIEDFIMCAELIDSNGVSHNPEDFYNEE
jgi:hypothetical protein